MKPLERDQKIVAALAKEKITAGFFCNSPKGDAEGIARIKFISDHGHLIANHSADHPDLHKTTAAEFIKNIDEGHAALESFVNFRKWFRFPFLHEGKDSSDVEAVRLHLKKSGYANGYVTVDTEDWYVDEVLRQKVVAGVRFHQKRLCDTYSRMMADEADLFDEMALKGLKMRIRHVILLHETDLNALCLGTLIEILKNRRWKFISPDLAYEDPIASLEPKSTSKLNNGRVFALALERGYKGPYFTKWIEEEEIQKELIEQKVWK